MLKTHLFFASVLALTAGLSAACDDKKPVDSTPSATTSAPTASAPPSATASASASATASASAAPSADPSASAKADAAAPTASAGATAGDAGAVAAPTCGKKPLPDCPLQGWMKANTSAAMATKDFDALAKALDSTAGLAPPGYPNWVSISRDGAKAARANDIDAVKASCRCHNQYQDRYKKELRLRKI